MFELKTCPYLCDITIIDYPPACSSTFSVKLCSHARTPAPLKSGAVSFEAEGSMGGGGLKGGSTFGGCKMGQSDWRMGITSRRVKWCSERRKKTAMAVKSCP